LLWLFAGIIVILRALQLPLLAPSSPPARRRAARACAGRKGDLADIGAGMGPMMAGLLLPVMSSLWLYGLAARPPLALAAVACGRAPGGRRRRPRSCSAESRNATGLAATLNISACVLLPGGTLCGARRCRQ
jgi:hypothetical protein